MCVERFNEWRTKRFGINLMSQRNSWSSATVCRLGGAGELNQFVYANHLRQNKSKNSNNNKAILLQYFYDMRNCGNRQQNLQQCKGKMSAMHVDRTQARSTPCGYIHICTNIYIYIQIYISI